MKFALSFIVLLTSMVVSTVSFATPLSLDLNNYKVAIIEVKGASIEVVFEPTHDSLGDFGSLKAQLNKRNIESPLYEAVIAAYTSDSLVDATLLAPFGGFTNSKKSNLSASKNSMYSITELRIKRIPGPDGK